MIQNSTIDRSLNRLLAHFGRHVVVRPHATAAELAELESLFGALPRDLTIFFATCNGLRVELDLRECERHLWHTQEILGTLRLDGLALPDGLMPVRGDAGDWLDCIAFTEGPVREAVVRWDASSRTCAIVASGFGPYLDRWTHYLTSRFDEQGHPRRDVPGPTFDALYASDADPELVRLTANAEAQTWLREFDLCASYGADFE